MRLLHTYRTYVLTVMFLLILGGIAGYAQNYTNQTGQTRPVIDLVLSGTVERNEKETSLLQAGEIKSGETINWTIVSGNSGTAPAQSHDAIGQIPAGTFYVENSAASDNKAIVSYSIDGGKTFSAQPMISEKLPDGGTRKIPAPSSMYNQIRFHWDSPLAVSAQRNAVYKVRVK